MGTIIAFPEGARTVPNTEARKERTGTATIIILPVVRIERYGDEPLVVRQASPRRARGRRRRRNA